MKGLELGEVTRKDNDKSERVRMPVGAATVSEEEIQTERTRQICFCDLGRFVLQEWAIYLPANYPNSLIFSNSLFTP
jgi:hypothetical protein